MGGGGGGAGRRRVGACRLTETERGGEERRKLVHFETAKQGDVVDLAMAGDLLWGGDGGVAAKSKIQRGWRSLNWVGGG